MRFGRRGNCTWKPGKKLSGFAFTVGGLYFVRLSLNLLHRFPMPHLNNQRRFRIPAIIRPFLFLITLSGSTFTFGQQTAPEKPAATIALSGEVNNPLTFTMETLAGMKNQELKAKGHDGKEHWYTGVAFVDLLTEAGVPLGKALRGKNLTKYVLVQAEDGYQAVFSLPELDPEFAKEVVLLAYLVDGKPLAAGEGPFRIVAPADKKQARWVRQLVSIQVLSAKE
jgi:hypothetical protein